MGFRGGGVKLPPPSSISWFSSTPAWIGLRELKHWNKNAQIHKKTCSPDFLSSVILMFFCAAHAQEHGFKKRYQSFKRVESLQLKTHRYTKKTCSPDVISSVILMFLCAANRNTVLRNDIKIFKGVETRVVNRF